MTCTAPVVHWLLIIVSVNTNLTSLIFCHSVISSHTACSFDISALCVSSDNKPNSSISFISACFQFPRMFFVIRFQLILIVVSLLFFGIFLLVSCSLPLGFHLPFLQCAHIFFYFWRRGIHSVWFGWFLITLHAYHVLWKLVDSEVEKRIHTHAEACSYRDKVVILLLHVRKRVLIRVIVLDLQMTSSIFPHPLRKGVFELNELFGAVNAEKEEYARLN